MATSIALTNGKGGVGKSTAAEQINSSIQDSLMISHDSTSNLSYKNQNRIIVAEKKNIEPKQASIFESFERKLKDDGSIEVINNFETYFNFIQKNNANAVYDLGGYDSADHRVIYSIVDHILIPTGLSEIDLQSLETMNETLKQVSQQTNKKIVGKVFACRIHHRTSKSSPRFINLIKRVDSFEYLELLDSVIYERADYVKASDLGFSVLELPQTKHSRAAREIKALVNELNISTKGEQL
ncbi:hypothetical protein L0991_03715 [Vibrio chagasii]|uniref:division plane positioning ATPase MipZ n=1 Tax=Vibrio chagasii TaxID=170679 RepID=UPI0035A6BFAB